MAAEYLNRCRARKGSPQFPVDVLSPVIVKWLAEWTRPIDLVAPETDADRRVYAEARRYCEDRGLHSWVLDQNENRGLTPRTSAVGERLDGLRAERVAMGEQIVTPRSNLALVKNRMYFSRWRRRMNVNIGHLPASGRMEVAEKREKVSFTNNASWKPLFCCRNMFASARLAPDSASLACLLNTQIASTSVSARKGFVLAGFAFVVLLGGQGGGVWLAFRGPVSVSFWGSTSGPPFRARSYIVGIGGSRRLPCYAFVLCVDPVAWRGSVAWLGAGAEIAQAWPAARPTD